MFLRFIFAGLFIRRRKPQRRPRREPYFAGIGAGTTIRGRCYVVDGDTVIIQKRRVRLAGIDAPELDQSWGQKSKWTLFQICKGQVVTAQISGRDAHGRLVATCFLSDGTDIGAEMVRSGMALDWEMFSGGKYAELEPIDARRRLRHLHVGLSRLEGR